MSEKKSEPSVLGGLPHSRPHRRSTKRADRPVGDNAPEPEPEPEPTPPEADADGLHILGTAVQAMAELAEIGLTLGARLLRSAISRLPRP
jgi:hypothetical protein